MKTVIRKIRKIIKTNCDYQKLKIIFWVFISVGFIFFIFGLIYTNFYLFIYVDLTLAIIYNFIYGQYISITGYHLFKFYPEIYDNYKPWVYDPFSERKSITSEIFKDINRLYIDNTTRKLLMAYNGAEKFSRFIFIIFISKIVIWFVYIIYILPKIS